MTLEIPGYYYDSAKRKYFRIERSQTAPAQAAWSSRNVRQRTAAERKDAARREQLRRNAQRVKRAPVAEAPLLGGLLASEVDGTAGPPARGPRRGEAVVRAWAAGLKGKGAVKLWPSVADDEGQLTALWVGGSDERTGLGVAYGLLSGSHLACSYVPRDGDDGINFRYAAEQHPGLRLRPRSYSPFLATVTGLKFHEPSGRMLVACRYGESCIAIRYFAPRRSSPDDSGPSWVLEPDSVEIPFRECALQASACINPGAMQSAPWSSRLTCIAGTDSGIVRMQDDRLSWLAPPRPRPRRRNHHHQKQKRAAKNPPREEDDDNGPPPWQQDILSVDFLAQNPAEVIVAGTRSSHVCLVDLRAPPDEWQSFRHASSAAHVRSVGAHEVLVAGPPHAMSLYDVRFLQRRQHATTTTTTSHHRHHYHHHHHHHDAQGGGSSSSSSRKDANARTQPVVAFPSYRNQAQIHVGLDVLAEAGYGSGIVAAAHDDVGSPGNTVGLYSLRDGTRMAAGAVDAIRAPAVVTSMMWQTLPGDRHPSLFVGEGSCIRKYSFWA